MSARRESREEGYDVVVIGGGMGGLAAASVMASRDRQIIDAP